MKALFHAVKWFVNLKGNVILCVAVGVGLAFALEVFSPRKVIDVEADASHGSSRESKLSRSAVMPLERKAVPILPTAKIVLADPKEAGIATIKALKGKELSQELDRLAQEYASQDPRSFYQFWEALPAGSLAFDAMNAGMLVLNKENPRFVLDNFEQLLSTFGDDEMIGIIFNSSNFVGSSRQDFERILRDVLAREELLGNHVGSFLQGIISRWSSMDLEGAMKFFQEVPAHRKGETLRGVGASALDRAIEEHPQTVVDVARNVEDPKFRTALIDKFAKIHAELDPAAALVAYQSAFTEGRRNSFVNSLFHHWHQRNLDDALKGLEHVESQLSRDRLLAGMMPSIASYDREAAAKWLETIQDPKLRKSAKQWLAD